MNPQATDRRSFLKTSLLAGLATAAPPWHAFAAAVATPTSRVALTTGTDRAAMAFDGLNKVPG